MKEPSTEALLSRATSWLTKQEHAGAILGERLQGDLATELRGTHQGHSPNVSALRVDVASRLALSRRRQLAGQGDSVARAFAALSLLSHSSSLDAQHGHQAEHQDGNGEEGDGLMERRNNRGSHCACSFR